MVRLGPPPISPQSKALTMQRSMISLPRTFFLAKSIRYKLCPTLGFILLTRNFMTATGFSTSSGSPPRYTALGLCPSKTLPSYYYHTATKTTPCYHSIITTTPSYHYPAIIKSTTSYHHPAITTITPGYHSLSHHLRTSTSLQAKKSQILTEPNASRSTSSSKPFFTEECEMDSQPHTQLRPTGDESSCVPLYSYMDINLEKTYRNNVSNSKSVAQAQLLLAFVIPMLAYMTYDDVARLFALFIDYVDSSRNWVAVDGGTYQVQIITPAINGIVVPSVSILFATLISNTINTLRQRQLEIRTTLNMEAGDLRILASLLDSYPASSGKDACVEYLTQYTTRLIAECQAEVQISSLDSSGSTDSEMNGFLNKLNQLVVGNENVPPDVILSESYSCISRLNSERSSRITAIQTTFPWLHYTILFTLAGSIALTFLIESNQELLYFLNALQLHMLWTVLIGTFSALGIVCYDLNDPFHGSYQILNAVDQLFTIRDSLKVSAEKRSVW